MAKKKQKKRHPSKAAKKSTAKAKATARAKALAEADWMKLPDTPLRQAVRGAVMDFEKLDQTYGTTEKLHAELGALGPRISELLMSDDKHHIAQGLRMVAQLQKAEVQRRSHRCNITVATIDASAAEAVEKYRAALESFDKPKTLGDLVDRERDLAAGG